MNENRMKVTEDQILGCKVRAEEERYVNARRKPLAGGFEVPPRSQVREHLSGVFGLSAVELSYYFTFTRTCRHPWSAGACPLCPSR